MVRRTGVRAVAAWACALVVASVSAAAARPLDAFPAVASAYLVKIQDETVWAKHWTKRLPPASLTKIMTALLILEDYRPQKVVAIGEAAAAESGTRLGLRAGDRITVEDLLTATLLHSANDACHALADSRAGDETRFVRLMNRRAGELGLTDTHFVNACGLDAPGHYSSARDLAVLTEAALRYQVFAELVATAKAVVHTADGRQRFAIENRNALIGRLPGVQGVKSGYTRNAGKCLVAVAERDGVRVLIVLLNAPDQWWHAHAILERAFARTDKQHGT